MVKRTPRRVNKQALPAPGPAALRSNGLKAFHSGRYDQAIDAWERAGRQQLDPPLAAALAEAYFRRGLAGSRADDLQRAATLQPNDRRYLYHLGLAAHQAGRLDEALAAYERVRQGGGELARRAAYPLALALLEQGHNPAAAPVWHDLTPAEQNLLDNARAFPRPMEAAPSPLWPGLAAYHSGQPAAARAALQQALHHPHHAQAALAHFYLGALAAAEEAWPAAAHHWSAARAAGFTSARLAANARQLYHRLAEERLAAQDATAALAAAGEAARYQSKDNTPLDELVAQAQQQLAYQAAGAGDWETALARWRQAEAAAGGSFRLAYNQALALEKMERFFEAAELWREALRRRPRRADHPDALTDEQVARLWQRAAEAYVRAEEYEEAIKVYRQALKWQPENLALRMALAEGLLRNGQFKAAENELGRILARNREYVPALLRMGEVVAQSRAWWQQQGSTRYWERVLQIEPNNELARQYLADYYQDQAEEWIEWQTNYQQALELYQKALSYQPENSAILVALGRCHLLLNEEEKGRAYFRRAVAGQPGNVTVYGEMAESWLSVGRPEAAWQVAADAEAAIPHLPYAFYLMIARACLMNQQPEVARPWLDAAVAKAPPGEPVYVAIGEMAVLTNSGQAIAREYLEKAIALGQEVGQAYLMLGILAAKAGDTTAAEKAWRQAEKIAKREKQSDLQARVQQARSLFSGPMSFLAHLLGGPGQHSPLDILNDMDEALFEELFGDFFDEEDEDEF